MWPQDLRIVHPADLGQTGPVLFAMVKDEAYFLPHFFRHYRELGVDAFLIYDDHSTDATPELLKAQPNCMVITSDHAFGKIVGVAATGAPKRFVAYLKEAIAAYTFHGRWVLTVDADEFMVLPPPLRHIGELTELLERRGQYYATAPMVDFYPENLQLRNYDVELNPFQGCPHFDAGPLYQWPPGEYAPIPSMRGIRHRLLHMLKAQAPAELERIFGEVPDTPSKTWKVPLLKHGVGIFRHTGHEITVAPAVDVAVALAHFKFYPGIDEKITHALTHGQYHNGSMQYKFLRAAIEHLGEASLLAAESRRYAGPNSLVAADLLPALLTTV